MEDGDPEALRAALFEAIEIALGSNNTPHPDARRVEETQGSE
jgi:hypothetical protein